MNLPVNDLYSETLVIGLFSINFFYLSAGDSITDKPFKSISKSKITDKVDNLSIRRIFP